MPVIADASHAAGNAELVAPLTLAAVAAGADGIMVECTPEPENARCDSRQQLAPERLSELKKQVENIRPGGTELC